jgi:hypothetical protein
MSRARSVETECKRKVRMTTANRRKINRLRRMVKRLEDTGEDEGEGAAESRDRMVGSLM